MIDLNELAEQAYITAHQRKLNGAKIDPDSVISMLKHCVGEVVEATEAYCNYCETLNHDSLQSFEDEWFEDYKNELADIIICCLIIAGKRSIDIESALNRVMDKNKKRAEKQGDKL